MPRYGNTSTTVPFGDGKIRVTLTAYRRVVLQHITSEGKAGVKIADLYSPGAAKTFIRAYYGLEHEVRAALIDALHKLLARKAGA